MPLNIFENGVERAATAEERAQTRQDIGALSAVESDLRHAAPVLGLRLPVTGLGNSHMAATPGLLDAFMSASPWVLLANAGVGGDKTADIKARAAADVPAGTRVCLMIEGTNDANAIGASTLALAQSMTNWTEIIAGLRAREFQPALVLPPPTGPAISYSWAVHQQRLAQLLLAEALGVPVYDPYRVIIDPTTGFYTAGASSDGLHALNPAASQVGAQLWADIAAGRLASLVPTNNEDRGITGTTRNCLMQTATSGVADGWTKGSQGVATTESASADGIAGNWQRLDATSLTAQAWVRADRVLPRVSQADSTLDLLHLQLALKANPGTSCTTTVGIEWRSADAVTLFGSTTIIGALPTSVAPVRLQRRLVPPAGAALARVIVSIQPSSGTYSGTVRAGEFRLIALAQARGLL